MFVKLHIILACHLFDNKPILTHKYNISIQSIVSLYRGWVETSWTSSWNAPKIHLKRRHANFKLTLVLRITVLSSLNTHNCSEMSTRFCREHIIDGAVYWWKNDEWDHHAEVISFLDAIWKIRSECREIGVLNGRCMFAFLKGSGKNGYIHYTVSCSLANILWL